MANFLHIHPYKNLNERLGRLTPEIGPLGGVSYRDRKGGKRYTNTQICKLFKEIQHHHPITEHPVVIPEATQAIRNIRALNTSSSAMLRDKNKTNIFQRIFSVVWKVFSLFGFDCNQFLDNTQREVETARKSHLTRPPKLKTQTTPPNSHKQQDKKPLATYLEKKARVLLDANPSEQITAQELVEMLYNQAKRKQKAPPATTAPNTQVPLPARTHNCATTSKVIATEINEKNVKRFVGHFLAPYIRGEINAENEDPNRKPLTYLLEKHFRPKDEAEKTKLFDLAFDAYLEVSIKGLYIHAEKRHRVEEDSLRAASPHGRITINDDGSINYNNITEQSPEFGVFIPALRAALPRDFPQKDLSGLESAAKHALEIFNLKRNIEFNKEYNENAKRLAADMALYEASQTEAGKAEKARAISEFWAAKPMTREEQRKKYPPIPRPRRHKV